MTAFSEQLNEHIEELSKSKTLSKTGVGRFDKLVEKIGAHLSLNTDEIYMVSCARPNNLNIRLTQGRAQHRHFLFGIGVIPNADNTQKVIDSALKAGATFIGNGKAQYDAVAVIVNVSGKWEIGGIVEANGGTIAARLKSDFPHLVLKNVNSLAIHHSRGLPETNRDGPIADEKL